MYYADTPTRRVDVFDFDVASGTIANRRPFITVAEQDGWPDGLVVDADGGVWLALWEGRGVRRYLPDGRLEQNLPVPVSCVTKPAFGGVALDDLYITSAWIALDAAARAAEPMAGGLFRCRPGMKGRPARRFAG
jgi:sugar lactone lactonase YvrE